MSRSVSDRSPSRIIEAICDEGALQGAGSIPILLDAFKSEGINDTIVEGDKDGQATHWWLLQMRSGKRVVFFGTPKTFEWFQKSGKGHAYQLTKKQAVV